MKTRPEILLLVVGGCALSVSTQAAKVDSADHPYKAIAATNVFRLKSAPEPEQPKPLPVPALPLITLQGFTTITGQREVLFKVTTSARPPEPAREIAYVLSEGQRMGEIEVLAVSVQARMARFSNHGVEQVLTLGR
jgi:hypothetical protein